MDNNLLDSEFTELNDNPPKIYSNRAIWGFSIFFSSIFGGVLLMQNLKDIGKKKEAYMILILSIIYTLLTIYIVNIPKKTNSSLTLFCNAIGGLILSKYFFAKYFPSEDKYEKKKIWKPLIISIIIMIPFTFALIYKLNHI
jgi:hypothetical protein